jgi:hypothetical protein
MLNWTTSPIIFKGVLLQVFSRRPGKSFIKNTLAISPSAKRNNMNKLLLAIMLIAALAFTPSCGSGDQARAKNAMLTSMAAYARCLEQHPDDPSQCEALKRAYEADRRAYEEAGRGGGPTITGFMEVGPGK